MVLVTNQFIFSWLSLILEETKNNLRYFLFQKIDKWKWCFKRLGDKTVWRRKEKEQTIFESILVFCLVSTQKQLFLFSKLFFFYLFQHYLKSFLYELCFNTTLFANFRNNLKVQTFQTIIFVIAHFISSFYKPFLNS